MKNLLTKLTLQQTYDLYLQLSVKVSLIVSILGFLFQVRVVDERFQSFFQIRRFLPFFLKQICQFDLIFLKIGNCRLKGGNVSSLQRQLGSKDTFRFCDASCNPKAMVSEAKIAWLIKLMRKYEFENSEMLKNNFTTMFIYLIQFFHHNCTQDQNEASESQDVTIVEPRRNRSTRRSCSIVVKARILFCFVNLILR